MRRCLFLIEAGHITAEQAIHAIRHQFAMRRPIGQLAVESGMMTMVQVFDILACQLDYDQPFGQIAIELGWLTHEELGILILRQIDSVPSLEEILIKSGVLTAEEIREAEIRYEAIPSAARSNSSAARSISGAINFHSIDVPPANTDLNWSLTSR